MTIRIDIDALGGGMSRQSGHGHDVTGQHHQELGAICEIGVAHVEYVTVDCASVLRIRCERELGLYDADGVSAVAAVLKAFNLIPDAFVARDFRGTINLLGDMIDLSLQRIRILVGK